MKIGISILRFWGCDRANGGTWCVEMVWGRRKHPIFQILIDGPFPFRFLNFIEPFKIGKLGQFGRHLSASTKKNNRKGFQSFLALYGRNILPPFVPREILAAQFQFVEVILQKKPSSLGILAGGEQLEQVSTFIFVFPSVGKFTA